MYTELYICTIDVGPGSNVTPSNQSDERAQRSGNPGIDLTAQSDKVNQAKSEDEMQYADNSRVQVSNMVIGI